MEKKTPQKNPCPDCTFCQQCSDSRCNMCVPQHGKKKCQHKKPKVHKPLFLKF